MTYLLFSWLVCAPHLGTGRSEDVPDGIRESGHSERLIPSENSVRCLAGRLDSQETNKLATDHKQGIDLP